MEKFIRRSLVAWEVPAFIYNSASRRGGTVVAGNSNFKKLCSSFNRRSWFCISLYAGTESLHSRLLLFSHVPPWVFGVRAPVSNNDSLTGVFLFTIFNCCNFFVRYVRTQKDVIPWGNHDF